MKLISAFTITAFAFALSGCLPDITESEFATPTAAGEFSTAFEESVTIVNNDGFGNGYAYIIGVDTGSFLGVEYPVVTVLAGVLPTTTVTDLPSSGQATFAGTYEVVAINLNQVNSDMTTGEIKDAFYQFGNIDMLADFSAGTLTGSGGDLTVHGTFNSQNLGGTVNYNGQNGALQGLVGGDGAVGVFQGNDLDEILVGGFTVN